ncbi:MAG: trigger factor [Pseudomonadota bacterium]
MQVSIESTGNLTRRLTVALPAEEINGKVSGKMQDLRRQVRLKGFRPGKVPLTVIEKRFGQQVRQEVLDEMVNQSFQEAVSQEQLRIASAPQIDIESLEQNEDVRYTAEFDVFPELENLELAELEIERPVAEVTDGDVDNMIETLRRQRQRWEDTDRAAVDGDLVFFHYRVEREDGPYPEEGEERAGAILGNGTFDPTIESLLAGLSTGDEKSDAITFGETFHVEELAGASGQTTVRVEKVQEALLPEVDDEFIAGFGVEEGGLEQFREEVKQNLDRELKQTVSRVMRSGVMNRLLEQYPDLDVPEGMVAQEQQGMVQQAVQRMQQAGQADAPAPDAEQFSDAARRRVKAAVLVTEVARHNNLAVDGTRVRDTIQEIASTYEDPAAVVNLYYSDEKLLGSVQNLVLEEQAVDCVLEQAKVTDTPVTFDELMQQANSGG